MDIIAVLNTINQVHAEGLIERYAIGGAVGATFYIEPIATLDVDVFLALKPSSGSIPITLQPLYDHFKSMGSAIEGEYVMIAGCPVIFLPPTGPLVEEALLEAKQIDVEGTRSFVFTAEHLAAIALQTGRAIDTARLLQFLESGILDSSRFKDMVQRHKLVDAWGKFANLFAR